MHLMGDPRGDFTYLAHGVTRHSRVAFGTKAKLTTPRTLPCWGRMSQTLISRNFRNSYEELLQFSSWWVCVCVGDEVHSSLLMNLKLKVLYLDTTDST